LTCAFVTDGADQQGGGDGVEGRLGDGDADHTRLVTAYEVVERLFVVKDEGLVEPLATPQLEPRQNNASSLPPRSRQHFRCAY
jgi:hypothetical protein